MVIKGSKEHFHKFFFSVTLVDTSVNVISLLFNVWLFFFNYSAMPKRHLSSDEGASSATSAKSKVMKKWWKEHRKSHSNALSEKEELVKLLQLERDTAAALREENIHLQKSLSISTSQCQEFQAQMCHVTKELMIAKTEVVKAKGCLL
jgi:hypothetical protein